jgi:hypothetical protein
MPASEVLTKILEDFTAGNPDMETGSVKTFCDYATTWLSSRGLVGIGHTTNGIALRFADGQELLLLTPDAGAVSVAGEMPITGTANKISKPIVGDSPSVAITGRV